MLGFYPFFSVSNCYWKYNRVGLWSGEKSNIEDIQRKVSSLEDEYLL